MNKDIQKRWVEALRSGKYSQTTLYLHRTTNDSYCCLGVLCELAVEEGIITKTFATPFSRYGEAPAPTLPPRAVREWAGLSTPQMRCLVSLNDVAREDFNRIADEIETY